MLFRRVEEKSSSRIISNNYSLDPNLRDRREFSQFLFDELPLYHNQQQPTEEESYRDKQKKSKAKQIKEIETTRLFMTSNQMYFNEKDNEC